MTKHSIKKALIEDSEVQQLFANAKELFSGYQQHLRDNSDLLDPQSADRRLNRLISEATSGDELRKISAARAEIITHSENTRTMAIKIARQNHKPVEAALIMLFKRCEEIVKDFVAQAVEAERKFFASFDLPREATSVSAAPKQVAADLAQFEAETRANAHGNPPSPRCSFLDWLKK